MEREGGHVRTENDLARGRCAKKIRHGLPRFLNEVQGVAAEDKLPTRVGVAGLQVLLKTFHSLLRDLGTGWVVEVDDRRETLDALEGGKTSAHCLDVDHTGLLSR